jgi:hypothetical protein
MLDERTNLAQQVMSELKRFFGDNSARRPSHGTYGWRRRPVMAVRFGWHPRSKGAESYIRRPRRSLRIICRAGAAAVPAEMDRPPSRSMYIDILRLIDIDV